MSGRQAYGLSDDGRVLWLATRTASSGVLTARWEKEPGAAPWDAAEIDRCLARARAEADEAAQTGRSGRSAVRRHRLPFGWEGLSHVSTGAPTWWWPRVRIGDGGFAAGWLRVAVEAYARRVR